MNNDNDTLPKVLLENYRTHGNRKIALKKKQYGLWQEYTWKDYYEEVKYFSLGLTQLGFQKGDVLGIVGDSDPEWFFSELSAQAIGGRSVGAFTDGLPAEIEYILAHADATFVVAKDQEQVDKIIEIKGNIPGLKNIIYWDVKGMWNYDDPLLLSFNEVKDMGRKLEISNQGLFEKMVEKGVGNDVAILSYTSGTTGRPRGIKLSHKNLLYYAESLQRSGESLEGVNYVAYQSPAWIWEQWAGLGAGLMFQMLVHFCEKPETVIKDIREISPYFLMLGPRQWENFSSTVQAKIKDTTRWKRILYDWGMGAGYKYSSLLQEKKSLSYTNKVEYRLADLLVLRAIRDSLGIARARFLLTGSASMSPDVFRFFHAMGAHIRSQYGLTECNIVCLTKRDDFNFDTVGAIFPESDVKISDEGEILVRGEQVFKGYHKDPETTAERIDREGWFHTGDAGNIDESGRLIFWDRLDELTELAGGVKFSPQYVETRLRFSPYIEDAYAIGDKERGYVTVIISIDFNNVTKWLEDRNIPYTTFVDLSQRPEVCELIKDEVRKINQNLTDHSKIKKFVNLHKSFDADEGELTRTRKLKRAPLARRYSGIIEAIYTDHKSYQIDTTVTYRDGRTGTISADLTINKV